jgi:hypothetical protein
LIVTVILSGLGVADFFIPRNWIQNLNLRASDALPVIAPIFFENNGELKKIKSIKGIRVNENRRTLRTSTSKVSSLKKQKKHANADISVETAK